MYKFIKTADSSKNMYDYQNVEISAEGALTLAELVKMFENFLRACEYSLDRNEHVDIV